MFTKRKKSEMLYIFSPIFLVAVCVFILILFNGCTTVESVELAINGNSKLFINYRKTYIISMHDGRMFGKYELSDTLYFPKDWKPGMTANRMYLGSIDDTPEYKGVVFIPKDCSYVTIELEEKIFADSSEWKEYKLNGRYKLEKVEDQVSRIKKIR